MIGYDASAGPPMDEDDIPFMMSRRRRAIDAEMDITPMIDMTFLLLIFFLVASTPDRRTAIDLPPADHGAAVSQIHSVVFTIAVGGMEGAPVYAADGRIPGAELSKDSDVRAREIREAVEQGVRDNRSHVIIKADRDVAHRDVARVIKMASQVEGVQIHLAVLETK